MEPSRFLMALAAMFVALFSVQSVQASSLLDNQKYAAIVVDADTQEVLYARNADAARHPASITKVMTLMLAFEEIDAGRLSFDDRVYFSAHAASQPPSKLGIGKGGWITVEQAVRLLTTKSANDVAVALAERVAGSETAFAQRMTEKARELGMNATAFYNASGLPNAAHSTTARDLATMSAALMRDFPHYYAFFSQRSYNMGGKYFPNHNRLLGKVVGLDGIKTGYTNASGFTLAASAQRDGTRLITIVLGAPSSRARNDNVASLTEAGFEVLRDRRSGTRTTVASLMNEPEPVFELWNGPATAQGSAPGEPFSEDEELKFDPTSSLDLPAALSPFAPAGSSFQSFSWLR
ncbi:MULTISPECIES: D-alanyl-D-alanine carboxypeptidase family protein [Pacificimonas]|nr:MULTISPECIES: D-alanyl-D-alanine carboxypeptidase family protein [Pacificimonas]